MMNIYDLLKEDKHGLLYLDYKDAKIEEFTFPEIGKSYNERRCFYKIDGVDNYIIKDSTCEPTFFNRTINRRLLKNLVDRQERIPNVDFPIGYFRSHGMMNGTIIPYYQNAPSIRDVIYMCESHHLQDYYNHESDKIDNLVSLLLDILTLLRKMQEENIYYLDTNTSNFVFYQNEIKVIDFDPGRVYIKNKTSWCYERLLANYMGLAERICHKLGYEKLLLSNEETFIETEYRINSLRKKLKGR